MGDREVGPLDPDAGEEVMNRPDLIPFFFGGMRPGIQQLSFHQNLVIPQVKSIDFNLAAVNRFPFGHFQFLWARFHFFV